MLDSIQALWQDLRHAARALRRAPGFTTAVALTLGLGVGANAAMFGVVDRLMFRPFPYLRDAGTVHRVYLQTTVDGRTVTKREVPYTRWLDLRRWTTSFAQTAAVAQRPLALGTGEDAREREVAGVSASLFAMFDARPVLGRFFGASEDTVPRGAAVVVLSYRYWREAFGGADVIGRPLQVGTVRATIVGVAPPRFVGVASERAPAAFIPITTFPLAAGENKVDSYWRLYNWDWTSIVVRRKPGVSVAAASADLSAAHVRSRVAQRELDPGTAPPSLSRPRAVAGALRIAAGPDAGLEARTLLWVSGVALVVLLIAAANVTNLLLARALRRGRETAVRLALGVSRRRLASQALAEALLLAALGAVVGVLVAQSAAGALRLLVPGDEPLDAATDVRTLAAAAACALAAALLAAVGPALLGTRGDLAHRLRGRAGAARRSRARDGLLVAQGALSAALLVGAALFVRSLDAVRALPLGYDADRVLMVLPDYRGTKLDSAARVAFRRRLLATAQTIPGVRYAARVNSAPFGANAQPLFVPGVDSVARLGRFDFQLATPDFFAAMGTRVVRGRAFTDADREGAPPVAIVSRSMARALWPGRDPLGRCLRVGADTVPCATVVGVAEDAAERDLTSAERFVYYLPLDQRDPAGGNRMVVRVAGAHAAAMAEDVRRALTRAMPGQGYVTVEPLADLVSAQRRSWELGATMFAAFGLLALAVAAVGLYGVVAYDVAQRSHELSVRVALGASARAVARLVVGEGVAFALAGAGLGSIAALVAAPWIQPLLFRTSATDPRAYLGVGATLVAVAALASALPARRAARADPNAALRAE